MRRHWMGWLGRGLRFECPCAELGEVRSGLPVRHTFVFHNDGPDPADLLEVRPGCGCLKPDVEPRRFGPGEAGTVPVEVNTLGQAAGPHAWHLTALVRDAGTMREYPLQVTATVVTEVSVQPAALTLFADGAVQHTVTLTDLRAAPLVIQEVRATGGLHARAGPLLRGELGYFVSRIELAVPADLTPGRHDEYLLIHTNDPLYRELKVSVTVVKRSRARVTATPAEVTLTRADPRLIRLRDAEDQPVVIECVTADHAALACSWAPGPEHQATVKVRFDPARGQRGSLAATVTVRLRSPVREEVTVAVRLEGD